MEMYREDLLNLRNMIFMLKRCLSIVDNIIPDSEELIILPSTQIFSIDRTVKYHELEHIFMRLSRIETQLKNFEEEVRNNEKDMPTL